MRALALTYLLLMPSLLFAQISVPGDYDTIQEAIDEAEDGDVIEVEADVYVENIDFLGKAITVLGLDGPDDTVIDGDADGSVVVFNSSEGEDSILEGFTITGGTGTNVESVVLPVGGGIFIDGASPTIRDCIIEGNEVDALVCLGGGIGIRGGSPIIEDCVIRDNEAYGVFAGGAGIGLYGRIPPPDPVPAPLVRRCWFEANLTDGYGGGFNCQIGNEPVVEYCVFVMNEAAFGGGIHLADGIGANLTIYGNEATSDGGGVSGGFYTEYVNCIIWGNDAPTAPQISNEADTDYPVDYCAVEDGLPSGLDGDGNIEDDPLFADADSLDFRLLADSPCIDTGDPDVTDADGSTSDMGAYPYLPQFLRGDVDGNGVVSALIDALELLDWVFGTGEEPMCLDAADADDSGAISALIDALSLLGWAFGDGDEPPDPGTEACSWDPTEDDTECAEEPECP